MRLIDADRLIDEFEDTIGNPISRTRLKLQVQNQPTIDAVEVVRCKDCKHAEYDHEAKYDGRKWYLCRYAWGQFNSETHFCSYGERKTDV